MSTLGARGATPAAKNCGQAAKPDEAVAPGRSTLGLEAVDCCGTASTEIA